MKISKVYRNTFDVLEKGGEIFPIGTNKSNDTEIISMTHDFGSRPIVILENAFAIQFRQFDETYIYSLTGEILKVIQDKLNLYTANSNANHTLIYNKSTKTYNTFSDNKLKDIGFYRRIDFSHDNIHFRIEPINNQIKISEFELHPEDTLRTAIVNGIVEFTSGRTYLGNKNYLLIPTKEEILIFNREKLSLQKRLKNSGSFEILHGNLYINNHDRVTVYNLKSNDKKEHFKSANQKSLFNGPVWVNEHYLIIIGVKESFVCIFDRKTLKLISIVTTSSGIPNSKRSVKFIENGISVFDMNDNCYIITVE